MDVMHVFFSYVHVVFNTKIYIYSVVFTMHGLNISVKKSMSSIILVN